MPTRAFAIVAFSSFASFAVAATCDKGQKQLSAGEPCIPENLFNYLYCLSKSGGGKVEVVKKEQTESTEGLEITVAGKASGVVIKGEAGGGFKKVEAVRRARNLARN